MGSGIINTMGITPDPAMQVVQVDSNTIQGQNQPITFHLQPMDEQGGPIRDVRDNIQGFNQAQSTTPNPAYQEFQNLLSNKVTPVEQKPFVRILEQPASHKLRFRYKCEGRGAGALQGERSTPEKKTFPKIQIVGYKGPAVVVVSCVTHDSDVPKTPGKYTVILDPVISKPIFDAKAKKELQIMDMSDNTAPADGGKKIIILCEKVSKEDIKVRFYDYHGWEEWADFGSSGVHKQYAISLTAPRYHNVNIREPVRVCVELVKPSDDSRSEEEEFFYTPLNTSPAAPPAPGVKRETVLRNIESKES